MNVCTCTCDLNIKWIYRKNKVKKAIFQSYCWLIFLKSNNASDTITHSAFLSTQFRVHWFESVFEGLQHLIHACIKPLKFTWPECCEKNLGGNLSHKNLSLMNSFLRCVLEQKSEVKSDNSDNISTKEWRICQLVLKGFLDSATACPFLRFNVKPHPTPSNQVLWRLKLWKLKGHF